MKTGSRVHIEDAAIHVRKQRRDMERIIRWYFGSKEAPMALFVAWQVSGLDPMAYHPGGGRGVGLFNLTTEDTGLDVGEEWRLTIPILNVAAAHRVWAQKGWTHWPVPALQRVYPDGADKEAF